jgi:hypothetical protein
MAEAEVNERVERTRRALGDLDHDAVASILDHDAIASILDLADSSRTRTPGRHRRRRTRWRHAPPPRLT